MLDCKVLLYEFEERLYVPPVAVKVRYLHPIEFQAVSNVRDERKLFD